MYISYEVTDIGAKYPQDSMECFCSHDSMCKYVASMIIVNYYWLYWFVSKGCVVWVWSSFVAPILKSLPMPLGGSRLLKMYGDY